MQDEYEHINFWHNGKPYRVEFCDKTDWEKVRYSIIEKIEITNTKPPSTINSISTLNLDGKGNKIKDNENN